MTSREALVASCKAVGITQVGMANKIGWTAQKLNGRFSRNSLRADEFLEMLDAIGIEVTYTVRSSGQPISAHTQGAGRRVRGMVDHVNYDTASSEALANNFYVDGIHQFEGGTGMELYKDSDNRYFFAEYSDIEGIKDRICPVTAEVAATFIEKYGTTLFREHE